MSQPTQTKLYFQKKIVVFVEDKLTFNNFKKYNLKKKTDESEDDFNTRAIAVWNALCEKADKQGNIQCEDEERDAEDSNEDCEYNIEEMIEEIVEKK
jgi:hypothetical protein